jgi:cell division protease FtsH
VDEEVRKLVEEAHTRARQILTDNMDHLHALAQALLTDETLDGEDVDAIMSGRPRPVKNNQPRPRPAPSAATPPPADEPTGTPPPAPPEEPQG